MSFSENEDYFERIGFYMKDCGFSLSEAMYQDICDNEIDPDDVYDLTDYLEEQTGDLSLVQFLLQVYFGYTDDYVSEPLHK